MKHFKIKDTEKLDIPIDFLTAEQIIEATVDELVSWYKENNPEPKELNYSDLYSKEGLALLNELKLIPFDLKINGEWIYDYKSKFMFIIQHEDGTKEEFMSFNVFGNAYRMINNWQLILAKPRLFNNEFVFFTPNDFTLTNKI